MVLREVPDYLLSLSVCNYHDVAFTTQDDDEEEEDVKQAPDLWDTDV